MPSARRSARRRRSAQGAQETPGAGSYEPNLASVEPSACQRCRRHAQQGRIASHQGASTTTDGGVGPGTYEAHADGSLAASVAKSVERMSRSNPGFGSRQPARELPYQKEQADMPGPGAYDGKARDAHVDGHASAFKSGSHRLQVEEETGDPGAYDPNATATLRTGDVVVWPLEPRGLGRVRRLVVS